MTGSLAGYADRISVGPETMQFMVSCEGAYGELRGCLW